MTRYLLPLLLCACGPLGSSPVPPGQRVVRCTLVPMPGQSNPLGGTASVQLAAVRIEERRIVEFRASDPVDPRQVQALQVLLPKGSSFSLFFQTPRAGSSSVGQLVSRIQWSNGHGQSSSRLPASDLDVDLGEVSMDERSAGTLSDNVASVPDAHNPLANVDRDGDGQSDLLDDDDDQDGAPDAQDLDADGDQLLDAEQVLNSLPDTNGRSDGDGVPDDME